METKTENSISSAAVLRWLGLCATTFQEHQKELTDLDAAIGDADHGANMARGFTAVQGKLASLEGQPIGPIFKAVAMTLISTVGGASGPLYGTMFLQSASVAADKTSLDRQELASVLRAGLDALMKRGKAAVGEKTMVDVLAPAVGVLESPAQDELTAALEEAVAVAHQAADSTIPLIAQKGRASYLGERSAGHMDPGARSSTLLLEALLQAVRGSA